MRRNLLLLILIPFLLKLNSEAQTITNGSVTGSPASNSGINAGNAPGWSGCSFSPDLCNVSLPSYLSSSQVTPSFSPDGGTWLGLASMSPAGATECAATTITGLTVGNSYTLYFCAACFGTASSICNNSPATPTISVGATSQLYTIPMAASTWVSCSLSFTATATTMPLEAKHSSVFGAYYAYTGVDGFSLTKPCGILLSVELLTFNVRALDNYSVKTDWQTISETDSDYFVLQRSEDGSNFYEIETIKAAGNSTGLVSYEFVDNELPVKNGIKGGDFYYRLKQVDINNDFNYSEIRVVNFVSEKADVLKVYPIPANTILNVDYMLAAGEESPSYQIFNAVGQKVKEGLFSGSEGFNTTQLNVRELAKGSYVIRMQNSLGSIQRRFVLY
jgi:hypothetical protein